MEAADGLALRDSKIILRRNVNTHFPIERGKAFKKAAPLVAMDFQGDKLQSCQGEILNVEHRSIVSQRLTSFQGDKCRIAPRILISAIGKVLCGLANRTNAAIFN